MNVSAHFHIQNKDIGANNTGYWDINEGFHETQ